ncbi:hypothetical protein DC3_25850 [Deinococcus cellulosilyticus NBRC 106333 = KACC 11606]|uniref:Cyanophycin synthetase n=1 Tax=Deinococcus cellulosilyticus (strain DSM 18568 / NBRC 106333 / KACC 11606 / 5516J-15) TaxID=1223518 RepID=A0A511N267_DEIC1|nr:hypothetical protein DC3_25850 [Deinococcus cellulosilyticus NBRC 106333 = KACC 11606]
MCKPLDGNHGRGITLHLMDTEAVTRAFELAKQHGSAVILEQQFEGRDHRVLVVGGRLVAVAERVPAHVVGDGIHTIDQLIDQVNQDPRRGEGHEKTLTRIKKDDALLHLLEQNGLNLQSVPEQGKTVYLRDTANISTGGTAIDRTDEIHPENRLICERAARAVGLDIAGMDLVCPDVTQSILETGGGIIEVNAGPGFRMHLHPSQGKARNVAKHVLDMLFPPGRPNQLPIVAITGTNGKSTTTRMVGHIMRLAGHCVGLTTSNGIYIGGHRIDRGDTTGPRSARTVLMDPEVDFAVLETARGGLLREGLAFENCTVGALLNIAEDHLGIGDVNTIEDLARVKGTVIEAVRKDGYRVLNADDPLTAQMQNTGEGTLIWFSRQGLANPLVAKHVQEGGTALVYGQLLEVGPGTASQAQQQQGWVLLYQDGERTPLIAVQDIPATMGGLAEFNIENSLAAAAIGIACQVSPETVAAALRSFHPSFEENPGRMNFFYEHPFTVLMDYAHNPAGLTHIGRLVEGLREKHRRVIGVLSGTGDRRDEDLVELGRIAGSIFNELIVKDDERRGREVGEGPQLVAKGAREAGLGKKHIQSIQPESAAVTAALEMARTGDLVVILASNVEDVWAQIRSFKPDRALLQID